MNEIPENKMITSAFLNSNPDAIFVFGDNLKRFGLGGAAKLRYHNQAYGFITKKYPTNAHTSFYKPDGYKPKFESEMKKLEKLIVENKNKKFLISQLGGGLANKYGIWNKVIKPGLKVLEKYNNVVFLF